MWLVFSVSCSGKTKENSSAAKTVAWLLNEVIRKQRATDG